MRADETWKNWLVIVKTKAVERVSEGIGYDVEQYAKAERQAALSGKLVSIETVETLYIAMDGTGVPVVPRETEGRKGKGEIGKAKTREVKLGLVRHYLQGGTIEQAVHLGEQAGLPQDLLVFPGMMFRATSAACAVSLGCQNTR